MSITDKIKTTTPFPASMESYVHLKLTYMFSGKHQSCFSMIWYSNNIAVLSFIFQDMCLYFKNMFFNTYKRKGVSMCNTSKRLYSVGKNCFSLYYYSSSTDDTLILSCRPQCTKICISVGTKSDIMLVIRKHSLLAIMCSCKCRDGANQNKS
jgi:hypothetical protein